MRANQCPFSGRLAAAKTKIRCHCGRRVVVTSEGTIAPHTRAARAQVRKQRLRGAP